MPKSRKPKPVNPKLILGSRKAPLRLVPPALEIYVSVVQALGGVKYDPYNWRALHVSRVTYLEAAKRHIIQALDGEDVDAETGVPHEASVAACMAIVLDAMSIGRLVDDRYKTGKVSGLLRMAAERTAEIRKRFSKKKRKKLEHRALMRGRSARVRR
jgi:hypothetical protein